jgi:hypothetical protein
MNTIIKTNKGTTARKPKNASQARRIKELVRQVKQLEESLYALKMDREMDQLLRLHYT